MANIIKNGDIDLTQQFRTKCKNCGCDFTFPRKEATGIGRTVMICPEFLNTISKCDWKPIVEV